MECRFVVWERMWLADPEQIKLIEHKCSTDSHLTCSEGGATVKNSIIDEEIDVSEIFLKHASHQKTVKPLETNFLLYLV